MWSSVRIYLCLYSVFTCQHILLSQKLAEKPFIDTQYISVLLDKADTYDLYGQLDSAYLAILEAETLLSSFPASKPLALAYLKHADLILKKDGSVRTVLDYANKGINIGIALKDNFIKALGYHHQGQYYRDQSKLDSALQFFTIASSLYDTIQQADYLAIIYNDLAFLNEKTGDYVSATENNLKAIRLFEKLGNIKEQANTMGNLGIVYYRTGNKQKAIELFKESAMLRESVSDIKGLAAIYGNLATAYTTYSLDSAVFFQLKALKNATQTGVLANVAQAHANAATLYARQKEYTKAIPHEKEAIKLYHQIGDQNKLIARYTALASLSNLMNDSLDAELNYQKANDIAVALNSKVQFQNVHLQKANFYKQRNNYKEALQHMDAYYRYKDSILNERTLNAIAELETKYETESKEKQILKLNSEKKINELQLANQSSLIRTKTLESENQKNQIRILEQEKTIDQIENEKKQETLKQLNQEALYRETLLANEKKLAENKAIQEKKIRNLTLASSILLFSLGYILFNRFQLKQKLKAQLNILQMRQAISKDLHDEVGSTLTSINVLSQAGKYAIAQTPDKAGQLLNKISEQSKTVQQNLSDIVWAIRSDTHQTKSLMARIREYAAATLEPENILFTIEAEDSVLEKSINEIKRKEIILIIKEALSNIVKHAHADQVKLWVTSNDNKMVFKIADNGVWKPKSDSTGTGIISMKDRARKLSGTLEIISGHTGTELVLKIPL